jgi:hypothetical protein
VWWGKNSLLKALNTMETSCNVMDTIHVWIGISDQGSETFYQYFAVNEMDRDAGVGASQFDKDLKTNWYDDDLIGVYYSENDKALTSALAELPLASEAVGYLLASRCRELNIDEANAMFYYTDSNLVVTDAAKKYNALTYLGAFDNR